MNRFEYVSNSKKDFDLPNRSTTKSAGYDFHSPDDYVIAPEETLLIHLGVKVQLDSDKFLLIIPRSSLGFKGNNFIALTNTVGIVDADYYNNTSNEGEISLKLHNFGDNPFFIKKNDKLVQGIILPYCVTIDDDEDNKEIRIGGFGSTDVPLQSDMRIPNSNIWMKK